MLPTAMSGILEIAVNVFLLLVILAFAGWVLWRSLKRSDDPARDVFKAILTIGLLVGDIFLIHSVSKHLSGGESPGDYGIAFVIAGSIAAVGIILSIMWTPQISDLLVSPLTSQFDGGKQEMEPK